MNVFYEESGSFKVAAIKAENPGSLQVEATTGKRSKIKTANVLLRFDNPLDDFMDLALAESDSLDTDFLWECCEEVEFDFEELAKAYYGDKPSNVQLAATAIKIHAAPVYFYRKGKGRYKAAPEETLKLALAAVEKKRLQAIQMAEWVELLNKNELPEGFAEKAEHLIYQPDKNSPEWKAIEEAAKLSGRLALGVLSDVGLIQSAHDYHLGAFLREMFPDGIAFPAHEDVDSLQAELNNILPMANVEAFSIDDAVTNEIDDAFSLEIMPNGNQRVGIHIAAPALAIKPGSTLDAIVMQRLSTVYIPGNKITMLPESIVRPFSLDQGKVRPVLSLYCEVAPDLTIVSKQSKVERIKIKENLRHDTLEPLFNANTLEEDSGHSLWADLKFLHDLAESLEKARGKYDPNRAPQIDYNFYVMDGLVSIVARERGSPMDKLVAELMIYANSTWGNTLKQAGFAGIYRAQQTGGKVFMTTEATPHQGMGLEQYAWCTSPLRRAVDLINQRQLLALLNDESSLYSSESDELKSMIRIFDQTYQSYSEFQTRIERYWCLQYLIQEELKEVGATVWRENLVRIDGMFYITKVPSLPTLKAGTRVILEIKHVDTLMMELQCKFKNVIEGMDESVEEIEEKNADI